MPLIRSANASPFPTTHWSLVDVIRQGDDATKRKALEGFLTRYRPALLVHLERTRGVAREESEDLVQEFIAQKILERDLVSRADRGAGKLRTFLLTSLERFRIDWIRRQGAQKRSPAGQSLMQIDEEQHGPSAINDPAGVFDVEWARSVIGEALQRMQQQCEDSGRADVWGVFQCRLVDPLLKGVPPIDYEGLVQRFGLTSPAQASNVLVTAKRMYARALRSVVSEYASDEEEIESEIQDLQGILAR